MRTVPLLISIFAVAVLAVVGVAVGLLYRTALDQQAERLKEVAQTQARMIEAIARHEKKCCRLIPPGSGYNGELAAMLAQLRDAHARFDGFGQTGEFTLARREGDSMVFLLSHRGLDLGRSVVVPFKGTNAEPMRRALSGRSGTVVGPDYRGVTVLAAHEPVDAFGLGVVAKIDMAEVRAPFVRAGCVSIAAALVTVLLGALLFHRVTSPVLRELAASEGRLRRLYSAMSEGLALHRLVYDDAGKAIDYRVLDVNPAFEAITGISRDQAIGRLASELYGTGTPPFLEPYTRVAETGAPTSFDTDWTPMDKSFSVAVFSPGRGIFATVFSDVTERRRAEQVLQESERRLRNAEEIAHLGSWELDLVANRLTWSDEVYRIFGLEPQECVASYEAFLAHVHPDDRAAVDAAYTASLGEGRDGYEIEHRVVRRKTGDVRTVHERCLHLRDSTGRIVRSIGMVLDVTERKRAEQALRESEEKFRALAGATPDHVMLLDAELRIRYANFAAPGLTIERLMGNPLPDFAPPGRAAEIRALLEEVLRTGTTTAYETAYEPPSGATIYFESRAARLGRDRLVVIARDITGRKRAEQALARTMADLQRSNEELEQFAYVASHDLQQPLRMVASYVELLAQRYRGRLDERADKYIGYASDGARRMQELINDLLSLSRVGTRALELKPVDLNAVFRQALANLKSAIRDAGADVAAGPLPTVNGDEGQLVQLFQNLLDNAVKFRADAAPVIRIAAEPVAAGWSISVTDNGIGIEPRHADRIFRAFQRLHTEQEYSGTGIGLAVCKRIVERHDGTIRVEPAAPRGSRFLFTLPRVQTPNGDGKVEPDPVPLNGGTR